CQAGLRREAMKSRQAARDGRARSRGLDQARIEAPIWPKPKTVSASAKPGKMEGHHWPVTMFWKPEAIIEPHSGVGARTPAPRKDRPAVRRTAVPVLTDIWARMGDAALGAMW